jgi:hypothetical protein
MDTNETLRLLRESLQKGGPADDVLAKAWTQSGTATSGLTAYDLEAGAKSLFPVITPLRNMIPRVSGKGGIQANWRAITGVNTTRMSPGVSQGNRGGVITSTTKDFYAAYVGLGLEDTVTFEAQYAGENFEDVRARATQNLLRSVMIAEEGVILGGNGLTDLGTTGNCTLAMNLTGGTIAHPLTVYVNCVALTFEGFHNAGGTSATSIVQTTSRTNADGSSDTVNGGALQKGTAQSVATASGSTNSVSASVAAIKGAYTTQYFYAVTTKNSVLITSVPNTGQTVQSLTANDRSKNSLVHDGLMYLSTASGAGGYFKALATGTPGTGTVLTSGTDGTISEFDEALQWYWDTYRLSPDTIWVSSQEMNYMRKKVLTGSSTAAQRFTFNTNQAGLVGGSMIRGYLNPFTMSEAQDVAIKLHPNLVPGTVVMTTKTLPYPVSGITDINVIRTRKEYYQIEWPQRTRKYEFGVYSDQVLQSYAPFTIGVITNIAAG